MVVFKHYEFDDREYVMKDRWWKIYSIGDKYKVILVRVSLRTEIEVVPQVVMEEGYKRRA